MYYNSSIQNGLRILMALGAIAAVYYALWQTEDFSLVLAREDGLVEYGTALFLFVGSLALIGLGRRNTGYRKGLLFFYALLFFFAAGEEISWGQRIFGIESSEFFNENNRQNETNLHNLVVGELHLASSLFGWVLTTVVLLYLVVLPILYPLANWVRQFCDILAAPVPPRHIAALAVIWSLFIAWIDLPRNWEVYEYAFSLFVCMIFFAPVNRATFRL